MGFLDRFSGTAAPVCDARGLRVITLHPISPLLPGVFVTFLCFAAARAVVRRLFAPVALTYVPEDNRRRFLESAWRAVLYGFACVYLAHMLLDRLSADTWFTDTRSFWRDWPNAQQPDEIETMALVYSVYAGMYLHELIFVFVDTPTSDQYVLAAHHVITLFLLGMSWAFSLTRIGTCVMLLHDLSDVCLCVAKCFNFSKLSSAFAAKMADAWFAAFAISFISLRLGVFPIYILHSAVFEACEHLSCYGEWTECAARPLYYFFVGPLALLQLLHCFWGWKLAIAIYRKLVLGKLDDVRETDD
jgi:hypothetical protein